MHAVLEQLHRQPTGEARVINPVHLRTLAAVIRLGSFAEAARHLGYTSSAISQHITSLEKSTKLQLFERDAHNVRPTAAAFELTRRSGETLAALDTLEADVQQIAAGGIGRLRLGSFPTASEKLLPRALASLAASHPNLQISLDEGEPIELVKQLWGGELDLALVYEYDLVPYRWMTELGRVPLVREEMVLLSRSGSLPVAGVELASLSDARWISTREQTAAEVFLHRACAAAGFDPLIPLRSNDYDVVRGLVASGLGVALVPALSLQATDKVVVGQSLVGLRASRHVFLVHRPTSASPVTDVVVDALRSSVRAAIRLHPHVHRADTS